MWSGLSFPEGAWAPLHPAEAGPTCTAGPTHLHRTAEATFEQCCRRRPDGNSQPAQKWPTFTNNVPAVLKGLPLEPGVQHLLGALCIPGLGIQCGAAVVGCHAVVGAAGRRRCQRRGSGLPYVWSTEDVNKHMRRMHHLRCSPGVVFRSRLLWPDVTRICSQTISQQHCLSLCPCTTTRLTQVQRQQNICKAHQHWEVPQ